MSCPGWALGPRKLLNDVVVSGPVLGAAGPLFRGQVVPSRTGLGSPAVGPATRASAVPATSRPPAPSACPRGPGVSPTSRAGRAARRPTLRSPTASFFGRRPGPTSTPARLEVPRTVSPSTTTPSGPGREAGPTQGRRPPSGGALVGPYGVWPAGREDGTGPSYGRGTPTTDSRRRRGAAATGATPLRRPTSQRTASPRGKVSTATSGAGPPTGRSPTGGYAIWPDGPGRLAVRPVCPGTGAGPPLGRKAVATTPYPSGGRAVGARAGRGGVPRATVATTAQRPAPSTGAGLTGPATASPRKATRPGRRAAGPGLRSSST